MNSFQHGGVLYRMKKRIICALLALVFVFGAMMIKPPAKAQAAFSIDLEENNAYLEQCGSIFMFNTDTRVTIYEKNAYDKMFPASTTKMMTALLAIELCPDMNTIITFDDRIEQELIGTDSTKAGFKPNERITMLDLLYGLMLPSGNDAALGIAYYIGDGDKELFVALMNERAQQLGCVNTNFVNPHGLHDENHYTCAYDLALIAAKAMEHPVFATIVSQTAHWIEPTNKNEGRYVYNTNYLMNVNYSSTYYYSYCKGIKTGRTSKAGNCFAGYATKNGYNYICVCMGAPIVSEKTGVRFNAAFISCRELFDWCFNNLALKEVVQANTVAQTVELDLAWNQDELTLIPEESFTTLLPTAVTGTAVMKSYKPMPGYSDENGNIKVTAPVKKGDVVAEMTLTFAGEEIGKVNLVASESVERSEILYLLSIADNVVSSTVFKVILVIVIIAVIGYIVWALMLGKGNSGGRNRRRVRRYR